MGNVGQWPLHPAQHSNCNSTAASQPSATIYARLPETFTDAPGLHGAPDFTDLCYAGGGGRLAPVPRPPSGWAVRRDRTVAGPAAGRAAFGLEGHRPGHRL